jgi:DtxR family manganese transport transcriptional regulator
LAESSKQRHDVVRNFLIEIGVEPSVAEEDAEGVEHHVSPETLEKFSEFLKKSGH